MPTAVWHPGLGIPAPRSPEGLRLVGALRTHLSIEFHAEHHIRGPVPCGGAQYFLKYPALHFYQLWDSILVAQLTEAGSIPEANSCLYPHPSSATEQGFCTAVVRGWGDGGAGCSIMWVMA